MTSSTYQAAAVRLSVGELGSSVASHPQEARLAASHVSLRAAFSENQGRSLRSSLEVITSLLLYSFG